MTKTILVLAANPNHTSRLRLDQEVREIDNGLQRAKRRDEFILKQVWAARPVDVRRAMLDLNPNIVHFCGHGAGKDGIAFEDEAGNTNLVKAKVLAEFFELFSDTVECVLFNGCYSEIQAQAVGQHINYVVGMKRDIGDNAAIEFSAAFYDALGAGKPIEFSYKLACNAIEWANLPDHLTPVLKIGHHIKSLATVRPPQHITYVPITIEEATELVTAVRPDISKSAEQALLALELTFDSLLFESVDNAPRLLAHLVAKAEISGLSVGVTAKNLTDSRHKAQLIKSLRKIAAKSNSDAAVINLKALLPQALPLLIREFMLLSQLENHEWWGWRIQLELADVIMPSAGETMLRAFGTILSKRGLRMHDSFVLGLVERTRQAIADTLQLDAWLRQVVGFTYRESVRFIYGEASQRHRD